MKANNRISCFLRFEYDVYSASKTHCSKTSYDEKCSFQIIDKTCETNEYNEQGSTNKSIVQQIVSQHMSDSR